MDIRRIVLFSLLAIVGYSLWTTWQTDYPQANQPEVTVLSQQQAEGGLLPALPLGDATDTSLNQALVEENNTPDASDLVHVRTDVLDLAIDLNQGDVVGATLLDYPVSVAEKDKPFPLLQETAKQKYVANSGLFTVTNGKIGNVATHFTSEKTSYELPSGQSQLVVTLNGKSDNGLLITKKFTFNQGSYLIDVQYALENNGSDFWKGYMNTQLMRTPPADDKSSLFQVGSYTGASYSSPGQHRFQKVTFKDMAKSNLDVSAQGGWIAMQQHYFLTAWVPEPNSDNRFYSRTMDGEYAIGAVSQPITVAPMAKASVATRLYLGPEVASVLKGIAPGLDLTIDYGWLWFLSSLLFSVMTAIFSVVGNWGWAIVLVTVLIKLAFYRLSATSYKSMAGMRKLQPKLQALRERYGDDKAKISQATMELYRQEKVNPLGGCLPILIQIPVFIALYWVLLESVELRQAPFIFWINDLAVADPYHVLPIIMGITMLIQQRLNPAPPDPMQAKVMMFLPVLFTGLFWSFPAGLVLYWIVNNTLSILQQWYITRKYSEDKPKGKLATQK